MDFFLVLPRGFICFSWSPATPEDSMSVSLCMFILCMNWPWLGQHNDSLITYLPYLMMTSVWSWLSSPSFWSQILHQPNRVLKPELGKEILTADSKRKQFFLLSIPVLLQLGAQKQPSQTAFQLWHIIVCSNCKIEQTAFDLYSRTFPDDKTNSKVMIA